MEHNGILLGVIGGLGPLSTARFMELTVNMTEGNCDQDNVDMIVYNFPSIPDRTGYILGYYRKSPLHGLTYVGTALEQQGVDLIAIPCMTAHYFYEELSGRIGVPIIDAVEETVLHLKANGIHKAGIMATEGTVQSGLFSNALIRHGLIPVTPSQPRQEDINHLIYQNIKAGKSAEMDRFDAVAAELRSRGAEAIILGCTELSLIRRDHTLGPGYLDAMEVLAQQSVLRCGKSLKPAFHNLIT